MAAREDKKFDAVLGGFLLNGLRRAGNLDCPEGDVLAAYHERSLEPEEMNSWKEHIVGCARCQALLAELEATDAIPVRVSEEAFAREEALLPRSAEPAAVKGEGRKPTPAGSRNPSRITPASRGLVWRWLAPAGALAAGLLVWVAWHENHPWQRKTLREVQMAKQEPPRKTLPPTGSARQAASPALDQAQTDSLARLYKDQAPAAPPEGRIPKDFERPEEPGAGPKGAPARPSANQERGARDDSRNDLRAASSAQDQPAQEGKAGLAGVVSQTVRVQTETANGQMPVEQSQSGAQKSAAPSPLAEAESGKKSKLESSTLAQRAAAPPSPTASAAFSDVSTPQALMARTSDWNLIVAPNKKTLWRAGHAGMIEFSSDGGASWSRQTSAVLVDLTAGSAPSAKVCWIVGRAGTILVTTDAGLHWAILHSPLEEDLGGVRATDALDATIWNLGNTKVFATADGGVTWKPAALP